MAIENKGPFLNKEGLQTLISKLSMLKEIVDERIDTNTNAIENNTNAIENNANAISNIEYKINDKLGELPDASDIVTSDSLNTIWGTFPKDAVGTEGEEGYEAAAAGSGKAKDIDDQVKYRVAQLVNAAPAELDTLKELADAITKHQAVYDAYVATIATWKEAVDSKLADIIEVLNDMVSTPYVSDYFDNQVSGTNYNVDDNVAGA